VNGTLWRRALAAGLIACLAGGVALAQRGGRNRRPQLDVEVQGNTPYDGRFTFVRLKYATGFGRWGNWIGDGGLPWSHDYPEGEVHFAKILEEITNLNIRTNGSNILAIDDPELFNYPVAYMAEPGFWGVTPTEAVALRSYLLKGGFLIFDDFRGAHWDNLQEQMRVVLPEANWIRLDGTAKVFHSFFEIDHPEDLAAPYGGLETSYWGLFEKNDPQRRLMVIANVNNDISEYWEFSGTGVMIVPLENEAYKFGVNYVIYGLTH
jgi:Domain of unknown function (DUF4159)